MVVDAGVSVGVDARVYSCLLDTNRCFGTFSHFNPNHDPKHMGVIILEQEPTIQSQHSPTIYYTNDERAEGLGSCEFPELVQKHSIYWCET